MEAKLFLPSCVKVMTILVCCLTVKKYWGLLRHDWWLKQPPALLPFHWPCITMSEPVKGPTSSTKASPPSLRGVTKEGRGDLAPDAASWDLSDSTNLVSSSTCCCDAAYLAVNSSTFLVSAAEDSDLSLREDFSFLSRLDLSLSMHKRHKYFWLI